MKHLSPAGQWRVISATAFMVLCAALLGFNTARAAVSINEFLVENDGGLRDADGDTPDWIELRNDSSLPSNLAGWHLTDSPAAPAKWTFPNVSIPPNGFLIVFASGRNLVTNLTNLHTNFRLESSGGYLALVLPDGTNVAQGIAYGPQHANVSFGPARLIASTALVPTNAPAQVFVPSDGNLGLNWTAPAFNDSGWFPSNAPVGFNAAPGTTTLLALDFNERVNDPLAVTQPGFTPFVINSNVATTAVQTQATTRVYGSLTVTISNTAPYGFDDRVRPTPANSGAFTESLLLRDFVFSNTRTNDGGLDVAIEGLQPNTAHRLTIWSFDVGSITNRASDWLANGVLVKSNYSFNGNVLPVSNEQYRFTFDANSDSAGRIILAGRRNPSSVGTTGAPDYGVFLNALKVDRIDPPPVPSGLGALMVNVNAGAYLRFPFTVGNPASVSALRLRLAANDGFAAYLNGHFVASRNAPAAPEWNSSATTAGQPGVVEFNIPMTPDLIAAGGNVLAIHGLNAAVDDLVFSIAPELIGDQITELSGRYQKPPTPGVANGVGFEGLVADTKFSVDRGFFDAPFSLSITTATAGAEIRYTTNGSAPSALNGFVFTAPLAIDRHSFVRAAAFKPGWVPSDADTHSYIFLRDVARQSNNLPGYPTVWQASYPADYGMDSNIVTHPVYGSALSNALRSIPSLMIVSDQNGLWNASTGIYPNSTSRGTNWERAASLELIDGDGDTKFAVTTKLEMHGNASRDNVRTPKHSLHAVFNSDYGPTRLRHDWFDNNVENHNKIIFRSCGFVDGWAGRYADNTIHTSSETGESFRGLRYRPENTCYLRDAWVKDSFRDMGWLSSRSQYVHLYLNGLYWGLYEPSEAPEASYFAEHLGGPEGAWDVLVGEDNNGPPVVIDGSGAGWTNVLNLVNAGINSEAAYAAITNLVDIDNLIDYMLIHIFAETEDWPRHNWYLAQRRATNGIPGTKFIFTVWDQELSLDRLVRRNRINVGNGADGAGELYSPARVYAQLRSRPEFRRHFGDRVHKHLFNGGALTPGNNVARMLAPANVIRDALIGESARWGDARKTGVPAGQVGTGVTFTRDEWWQPEIDKLTTNFFQKLTADNIARLRAGQLYPNVAAPDFSQFGGAIPTGFQLTLSHTNVTGVIYFTTDGSDPRTYGSGTVAGSAQAYSTALSFNAPTLVRARVLASGAWSALCEAAFYPPQDLSRLALTELMYHPPDNALIEGDEYEFIELKNTGTNTLNLGGLAFEGVNFTFTNGTTLAPGAFVVLVRNPAAFATKYPGVATHGVYSGRLDNAGEPLRLNHPFGGTVFSVTYDDEAPWPATADGHGFSLVPRSPGTSQAPDSGTSWRASTLPGGSPGADDPSPTIPAIVINEVLTASVFPQTDRIELFNPTATPVNIGGWFLSDEHDAPRKFRIADGTMIPAGGFVVFGEAQFNATPGTNGSFSLSSRGESLHLFSGDTATNLTGYSHDIAFDAADSGISFGRHLTSVGEEHFTAQLNPTFGGANSGPRVGPVVISEIHYNPAPSGDEFIELANMTDTAQALFDPASPTNTWRVEGIDFTFPANFTLSPRALLLIVATNPASFRAKHEVPPEVSILGPFSGGLQDSGERLRLVRPVTPDTNGTYYVTVDSVRYNDKAPWPAEADGAGLSLQRRDNSAYGDDPANWEAAGPTPGRSLADADFDGDGLPDVWEIANGTDRFTADADADPDNDGATNRDEFLAGTDPQSAGSFLKITASILAPGSVRLEFTAKADRSYSVLYKSSLVATVWQKLQDIPASTSERSMVIEDSPSALENRFYRIVTPQQP